MTNDRKRVAAIAVVALGASLFGCETRNLGPAEGAGGHGGSGVASRGGNEAGGTVGSGGAVAGTGGSQVGGTVGSGGDAAGTGGSTAGTAGSGGATGADAGTLDPYGRCSQPLGNSCPPTIDDGKLCRSCASSPNDCVSECGGYLISRESYLLGTFTCYYDRASRTLVADESCTDYYEYCGARAYCLAGGADVGSCTRPTASWVSPPSTCPPDGGAGGTDGSAP